MEQELVGVVIGDNEGYVRVQGAQFFSVFRRQSANPFDGIFVFAVGEGEKLGRVGHTDAPDYSISDRHDAILHECRREFGQNCEQL